VQVNFVADDDEHLAPEHVTLLSSFGRHSVDNALEFLRHIWFVDFEFLQNRYGLGRAHTIADAGKPTGLGEFAPRFQRFATTHHFIHERREIFNRQTVAKDGHQVCRSHAGIADRLSPVIVLERITCQDEPRFLML